jgi:acetyltransferase-like isoleucine patch superfamily enzyme
MFSVGVSLFPSDGHAIMNDQGDVINAGKYIKIGNHVWAGGYVTICKNTEIADNCVIGTQSVVSGKFTEPNCILAGNPARVVKRNISWDRRTVKEVLANK